MRAAADVATLPEDLQRAILAQGEGEVVKAAVALRKRSRNTVRALLKLWDEADEEEQDLFLYIIGVTDDDDIE